MSAARAIAALRALAASRPAVHERCELCAAVLDERHAHLFQRTTRTLACACAACAACFDEGAKWTRVVSRAERIDGELALDWTALGLPVRLAWLTQARRNERPEPIAILPSPGGPIEATLSGAAWDALRARTPIVSALEPDVDGLLAWELGARARAYRLSIDHAYRLIGTLRARWHAGDLERTIELFCEEAARA